MDHLAELTCKPVRDLTMDDLILLIEIADYIGPDAQEGAAGYRAEVARRVSVANEKLARWNSAVKGGDK